MLYLRAILQIVYLFFLRFIYIEYGKYFIFIYIIPAHRNNNNTELWKCQIKRNFWNLYTIFTTTMDVSLCTLANSDYGLPFLVTIYSANH